MSLLPASPLWIVARKEFSANNLSELIDWLKANPGKASAAIPAPGSGGHVALVHLQQTTGTRFQLVPYRGGALAIQDLLAGHVDLMCGEASQMLSHVRAGQMKAYAILAKSRWTGAPEVPTIDEAGVPGLHITFWHGLWNQPVLQFSQDVPHLTHQFGSLISMFTVSNRITTGGRWAVTLYSRVRGKFVNANEASQWLVDELRKGVRWSRLFGQFFRFDEWSLCGG